MGKHYFYEVDYRCECEACGPQFQGVIRRGPLEYAGGVIPSGVGAALDDADMVLSRKLRESAINGTGNQPYLATNADSCPHCGARQSWYPLAEPKKPGGIGGYIAAAVGGMVVGLILWLILFFDAFLPFLLMLSLGAALGVFLVYRSRRKNGDRATSDYRKAKQEYDSFARSMAERTVKNKPELLWETARRAPLDF